MTPQKHLDSALAVLRLLADDAEADGIHWNSQTSGELLGIVIENVEAAKDAILQPQTDEGG